MSLLAEEMDSRWCTLLSTATKLESDVLGDCPHVGNVSVRL